MPDLFIAAIAILAGFAGLVWGADRFVMGSASIARNFGISKLVIGLTIVSLGTSAPEILVSLNAALKGAGEIAIGNALGSNLANIGLVLAATLLIAPIPVQRHLLHQEIPILLLVTLAAGFVLYSGDISRVEGLVLLLSIVPLLALTVWIKRRHPSPEEEELESAVVDQPTKRAAGVFLVGLVTLLIASEILVWGAREIATSMGVSELVIGLTIIAIGTSLPELAASVMSALKGHHDIAIGNVVGSNIFNILAVMSLPGIVAPLAFESVVFNRDYLAMLILTLLLISIVAFRLMTNSSPVKTTRVGRFAGALLLLGYIAYYIALAPTMKA